MEKSKQNRQTSPKAGVDSIKCQSDLLQLAQRHLPKINKELSATIRGGLSSRRGSRCLFNVSTIFESKDGSPGLNKKRPFLDARNCYKTVTARESNPKTLMQRRSLNRCDAIPSTTRAAYLVEGHHRARQLLAGDSDFSSEIFFQTNSVSLQQRKRDGDGGSTTEATPNSQVLESVPERKCLMKSNSMRCCTGLPNTLMLKAPTNL